ncbi:MAG: hypothetical protein ABII72_02685 [Parcubacteria group bacterium]
MAGYLTITNARTAKRGIRKRTVVKNVHIGPVTFVVTTVSIFALIGFLFLAQLFQTSTKGYEISALRDQVGDLKDENKKLEIKAAELRSFENVNQSVEKFNMVKSNNVVYLKKVGGSVVVVNK